MSAENNDNLMNEAENVKLVSIGNVMKYKYSIPMYQRGYRWGKEQINALLDDLYEFYCRKVKLLQNSKENKEVYCLQPLVIKRDDADYYWNVVDGQQRLTTLYLLMRFLYNETGKPESLTEFEIRYESRNNKEFNSWEYLKRLSKKDSDVQESETFEYQDYYYMALVYKHIKEWKPIQNRKPGTNASVWNKIDIENYLSVISNWVVFICYKLPDDEKETDVFKRLNIGKIRLTESELIKALFLSENNFKSNNDSPNALNGKDSKFDSNDEEKRLLTITEIANEWDRIEYRLQDDRFWLFIHEPWYDRPTRIDFILELAMQDNKTQSTNENEENTDATVFSTSPVFDYYYEKYSINLNESYSFVKEQWEKIHKVFEILNEWYGDEEIYHYIGYLSTVYSENRNRESSADLIRDLINKRMECKSKRNFIKQLKYRIRSALNKRIRNLDYEYEIHNELKKKEIRPMLLLHNIQTVIDQNACITDEDKYSLPDFFRFPFHLYRKERWDIEHIRPNNPIEFEGPRKKKLRRRYSYVIENCITKDNLQERKIDKTDLSGIELRKDISESLFSTSERISLKSIIEKYNEIYERSIKKEAEAREIKDEADMFIFLWHATEKIVDSNELSERDKNKAWNYVLLDASTNREYGNSAYSIKRDFIMNKEKGIKPVLEVVDHNIAVSASERVKKREVSETAFVPVCTMRVFAKSYTEYSDNLQHWTLKDAAYYRMDIEKRLWWYLYSDIKKIESVKEAIAGKGLSDNDDVIKKEIYYALFEKYKREIEDKETYAITMKAFYQNAKSDVALNAINRIK